MLPITVIVPTKHHVAITVPDPVEEVIIVTDDQYLGNAAMKRHWGAQKSTQDFLFFMDDDVILKPGILFNMLGALLQSKAGYVYCDWIAVNHPCNGTYVHQSGAFSADRLRHGNYISTMSLMRRSAYEAAGGFDPAIERLQDWDLWLSMLEKGIEGQYLQEIGFTTTYSPDGITQKEGYREAERIVKEKHHL